MPRQVLHLVIRGDVVDPQGAHLKDLSKVDILGFHPNYAEAERAWRAKGQMTVHDANTRYFVVHRHRLVDSATGAKKG